MNELLIKVNNNTSKFYACTKACGAVKSRKSWWTDYKILWGHKNIGGKCEGILVSKTEYYNKLINFAYANPIDEFNETYQMDITRVKSFFGDHWTLSNVTIYGGDRIIKLMILQRWFRKILLSRK